MRKYILLFCIPVVTAVYAEEIILSIDELKPIPSMENGSSAPSVDRRKAGEDVTGHHGNYGLYGSSDAETVKSTDESFVPLIQDIDRMPQEVIDDLRMRIQELSEKGYIERSNEETDLFKRISENLEYYHKMKDIIKQIPFKPTDDTPIKKKGYRFVGAMPGGVKTSEGWMSLERIFHSKIKGYLLFTEDHSNVHTASVTDRSNDSDQPDFDDQEQGGVMRIAELMNVNVRGSPASLSSVESPNGTSITNIGWTKNDIHYGIVSEGNYGKQLFRSRLAGTAARTKSGGDAQIMLIDMANDL